MDVVGTNFKIELFRLSADPHDQERFARRVIQEWRGRQIWVPTAEDVIIMKLRWLAYLHRPKDRQDVKEVISVQGDSLDWTYLERWCDLHDTRELLETIKAEAPRV